VDRSTRAALMSELGKIGGRARAKKLSKARRRQIASQAGKAGGRGRPKKRKTRDSPSE
jgi:hypothetical protein